MSHPTEEFVALQAALAGRYSLDREIGRGGMGIVFLARDVALDRPVAIKLLPPAMAGDTELRERFLREARTAAQLTHPNIVPIHLVEEQGGSIYFVMALVEGESLGDRLRRVGALPPSEVVRIVQEVAWALAYAHGRGVVHRDIKPDNILLERGSGRALLTDFGIARSVNASTSATVPGMILGTLQYIAPEQADGSAEVDGRADLYALGVTGFYALTGRLPFQETTSAKLLAAHMLEPAPPLASVAPNIDARIGEVVDRCLLKDPAGRWQTGEELARALAALNQAGRAMPPTVRKFVSTMTASVSQLGLIGIALTWASLFWPDQYPDIAKVLGLLAIAPIIPILDAARAVAIAGYTTEEVLEAVRVDKSGTDAYTQYVERSNQQAQEILHRPLARFAYGLFGVVAIPASLLMFSTVPEAPSLAKTVARAFLGTVALGLGSVCLGHALQIGVFKRRAGKPMQAPANGAWTLRFWRSWPMRAVLALGRKLMWTMPKAQRAPRATVVENKPTEMVLGAAVEEVFAALSDNDRAAAANVPAVIERLQHAAARLREKQSALDESIGAIGNIDGDIRRADVLAQMQAERALVVERLRSTVAAMEGIRLDLLKLRAGVGSAGELTAAIEATHRIGEDIDYTLQGKAEAAKL